MKPTNSRTGFDRIISNPIVVGLLALAAIYAIATDMPAIWQW